MIICGKVVGEMGAGLFLMKATLLVSVESRGCCCSSRLFDERRLLSTPLTPFKGERESGASVILFVVFVFMGMDDIVHYFCFVSSFVSSDNLLCVYLSGRLNAHRASSLDDVVI